MSPPSRSPAFGFALLVILDACAKPVPPPSQGMEALVDVTAQVGLDFQHFNGMTGARYLVEMMVPGVALADLDGDGDLDLYFRQGRLLADGTGLQDALDPPAPGAPSSDRLFRSDRVAEAPSFRLLDRSSGLDFGDYGAGVAAGDFDRDGAVDLYLTSFGEDRLLRNRGDASFEDVTSAAGVGEGRFGQAAVFFDYDRDGWLDLYVQNYVNFTLATHKPCFALNSARDYCGPLSFSAEPDRLFRNRGDGTFADVSAETGIALAYGAGLSAAARDFDGDGWLDLYVNNDAGDNLLWINRAGTGFEENARLAGCAVNAMGAREGSMGIAAADFDRDLDLDIFVTHLAEETNTLYLNDGGGYFTDATAQAGLAVPSLGYTGFGTAPVDLDNDGLEDLIAVNGEVRVIAEQEAAGEALPLKQHNQVFRNLGAARFVDASDEYPAVASGMEVSRALATGDLDSDGAVDLVITNNSGPAQVLWNRGALEAHWLGVALRDPRRRLDGAGSRIVAAVAGHKLLRSASSDGSYLAASDPRVVFGLGESSVIDSVEVEWTVGGRVRMVDPPADRYLIVGPSLGSS